MADPKGYRELESAHVTPAAELDQAQRALEAKRAESQATRRGEREAEQAAELAEQERLREAVRESDRLVAAARDWRDSGAFAAPPNETRPAQPEWDPRYARPIPVGQWPTSARQEHAGNAVENVVGDGLLREEQEQLVSGQSEASAGAVHAAAFESSTNKRPEENGCDAHTSGLTFAEHSVNPQRMRDLESAWLRWVDSKYGIVLGATESAVSRYAISLDAITLPEYTVADARDATFAEELYESIFTTLEDGKVFERRGKEALARWLSWFHNKPPASEAETRALEARMQAFVREERDFGSRVQIVEDRAHIFSGGDAASFASAYAKTLPLGWSDGVVLSLRPGRHVVVCRWRADRLLIATTHEFCRNGPRLPSGELRFRALDEHDFDDARRIVVPGLVPAATGTLAEIGGGPSASEAPLGRPGIPIWSTGIASLDAALDRTGGIPRGARVVVQAGTGQAKTLLLLEKAESLAAAGLTVVWLATGDDDHNMITGRRRQRVTAMSQGEALQSGDNSMLNPKLMVFDGRTVELETILACKNEIDVLVIDPITKVRARGATHDPLTKVGYALDLIEQTGLTTIMTVPTVRNASQRAAIERSFGGARIESGASLLLEMTRKGSDLTLSILKSRYGGEDTEVPLRLDMARQRVLPAAQSSGAVRADERIWNEVQRLLAERAPRSVNALCRAITGKTDTIRDVVRARLATGELVSDGRSVRLPS